MNGHQRNADPRDPCTYREDGKLEGGTHCPSCGLVVREGRWIRGAASVEGPEHTCPACARIRDRYPAGVIELHGELGELATELGNLIRNIEKVENQEHPLERLIELEVTEGGLYATTTGVHLARRVGSALKRQLRERVVIRYGEEENLVRIEGAL
ncbi:MAG: BCAM0308 family protein [Planctomycetota bacterium]|nr:BCAM0308 family protein [Planctomycetota bacterium]